MCTIVLFSYKKVISVCNTSHYFSYNNFAINLVNLTWMKNWLLKNSVDQCLCTWNNNMQCTLLDMKQKAEIWCPLIEVDILHRYNYQGQKLLSQLNKQSQQCSLFRQSRCEDLVQRNIIQKNFHVVGFSHGNMRHWYQVRLLCEVHLWHWYQVRLLCEVYLWHWYQVRLLCGVYLWHGQQWM